MEIAWLIIVLYSFIGICLAIPSLKTGEAHPFFVLVFIVFWLPVVIGVKLLQRRKGKD